MKITTELFMELEKFISKLIKKEQIIDSIQGTTDIERRWGRDFANRHQDVLRAM